MKKRIVNKVALIIGMTALSFSVLAESLTLADNHPEQYTVVKGDTLWDVSSKFLKDPWRWPSIWSMNQQIKNPHWIYPGDTLVLSYEEGQPQIKVKRGGQQLEEGASTNEKITPTMHESLIEQPINTIPYEKIKGMLLSPKIVSADELSNSPYIVDFVDQHIMGSSGDQFFAMELPTESMGKPFVIYRPGEVYVDPETQAILGYEAKWVGEARINVEGSPAVMTIGDSKNEVRKGDRLIVKPIESRLDFYPSAPDGPITASIIKIVGGVMKTGQFDVVVLNKGEADSLKVGNTLDIYQSDKIVADTYSKREDGDSDVFGVKQTELPGQKSGSLMVFRVFEHLSYAIILTSQRDIGLFDKAKNPG